MKLKPGTGPRKRPLPQLPATEVAEPQERVRRPANGYAILAPGIGGTGVVTINALLATAAWIDGLSVITLDQTGLAQKGGAVVSSIILSEQPIEAAAKIGYGNADLLLGFDLLGAGSADNLKRAHPSRTVAVVNTAEIPDRRRGARRRARWRDPGARGGSDQRLHAAAAAMFSWMPRRLAEGLFASHMAVNVFLLGVAYQGGLLPFQAASIEEAIRLNGVDAERNLQAFLWGRKYYQDARAVEALLAIRRRAREEQTDLRGGAGALSGSRRTPAQYTAFLREVESRRPELARYSGALSVQADGVQG